MTARITELLAKLRARGHEIWVSGPAAPAAVRDIEKAVGFSLPPSYASFLLEYGAMAIRDDAVSGVISGSQVIGARGTALGDTEVLRKTGSLPVGLLVVGLHQDGGFCLDLGHRRADGECPVVNFEFGSVQHEVPVAASFEDWLSDFYLVPRSEEIA